MLPLAQISSNPIAAWQNFYVIIGSCAGALVGLQFVVIALIANSSRRPDALSINAFGTPTIVHFTASLALAAVMTAPWQSMRGIAIAIGASGMLGLAYSLLVCVRTRRQTAYKPVLVDWIWYAIAPCKIYAILVIGAGFLNARPKSALFVIGGAVLALMLTGIRNAWDSVTHIVVNPPSDRAER